MLFAARFTLLAFLAGSLLIIPTQASTPVATVSTDDLLGTFTGLVPLQDGRLLYVECAGAGSPTVFLVSGYRSRADVWTDDIFGLGSADEMVFPALTQTTRVCTYDRPGTMTVLDGEQFASRSDAAPMPRSAEDAVAELRELRLLITGDEPVVLVAHSLGGLLARLYTAMYPEDIAGLVLVDAYSEFVEANMPAEEFAAYADYASFVPDILANYTDYETIDFAQASHTMRTAAQATPLPHIPYVVLSKGMPFGLEGELPGFTIGALESAWSAAQNQLAELQPDTPHETVADSSHYVQLQRPDVVIAATESVINSIRSGEPALATPIP